MEDDVVTIAVVAVVVLATVKFDDGQQDDPRTACSLEIDSEFDFTVLRSCISISCSSNC